MFGEWLFCDLLCEIVIYNLVIGRWEFDFVKFVVCLVMIKDLLWFLWVIEYIGSFVFLYLLIYVIGYDSFGYLVIDDGGVYLFEVMFWFNFWGVGSWKLKFYEFWYYDVVVYEWLIEE